ncbi:MAG: nuclear transport factor 2 family protein [Acidimicrobiales bacterium]
MPDRAQASDDKAAITELLYRYAYLLDAGDLDAVAALFEHAEWRSDADTGVVRGSGAVRRIYDRVILYDGRPRTRHVISNVIVEVDASGAGAASSSYFTVFQGIEAGRPIEVIIAGQYRDRFEKVDGEWRFALRTFVVELTGDLRRHFR